MKRHGEYVADKYKRDKHILRFSAKLISTFPSDEERAFIISYFVRDESIMVYEMADRNSGRNKGKFLEKFKKMKLFEKKNNSCNKINKRTGSFGLWVQTDPADGCWVFKFNPNHNLQVPFFSGMLPEMAAIPTMRNLQLNQS